MKFRQPRMADRNSCQVLVQQERFIFCHYFWNTWYHGFFVFSLATTKCTVLARSWDIFDLLLCHANQI